MGISSDEEFIALVAKLPKATPLELPGGATVFIRRITTGERDDFEREQSVDPYKNARARILVIGICDPEGKPIFTRDDFGQINRLPAEFTEQIFEAILNVNKMRQGDVVLSLGSPAADPVSD